MTPEKESATSNLPFAALFAGRSGKWTDLWAEGKGLNAALALLVLAALV